MPRVACMRTHGLVDEYKREMTEKRGKLGVLRVTGSFEKVREGV